MAVTWGKYSGHLVVGYTVVRSTSSPEATVTPYIGTDGWDYADNQTLTFTGTGSGSTWNGSQTKYNGLSGNHSHQKKPAVKQMAFSARKVEGSAGQTRTLAIRLSGSYIPSEEPEIVFEVKLANVPSKPATPTVTGVTQSQATVNMVMPASNYSPITNTVLQVWTAATGGSLVQSDGVSDTRVAHTFTGLNPATTYYAQVAATNGIGTSTPSTRKAFTTGALVAPSKPSAPVNDPIGDTTVTVTGTAPTTNGATITTVQVQVLRTNDTVAYDNTAAGYARNVTGLTIGTNYKSRYRVNSNHGPSEWSNPTAFSTTAAEPGPPTGLAVNAVVGTQFSWLPPVSNGGSAITQYGVEVYSDDAYTVSEFSELSATSPVTADILDLPTDTQLWWRVRAKNAIGWGPYANGAPFYLDPDGGIYYYPPEGGPAVRAYMYWFNDDGAPVLVM